MDTKDISTGNPYVRPESERPKLSEVEDISTGIPYVPPESERPKLSEVEDCKDVKMKLYADDPSTTMSSVARRFVLLGGKLEKRLYKPQRYLIRLEPVRLSDCEVHERYNQELFCLFNMFHNHEIGAKKLDAALKSLEEKYYESGTDCCRFIRYGDVAGTSLSRPSSHEGPSTSRYPPGTNACGGGVPVGIGLVNNNGDPCSSVKHSPPGKGKAPHEEGAGNPSASRYPPGMNINACGGGVPVGIGLVNNNEVPSSSVKHSPPGKGKAPHEEGAGGFANVSGDATGSMNVYAPSEGDLEMGRVNNNGDPPAPGDVPSSVVPHVGHTADRSGEYGVNVARTVFRVAAAASRTTTSNFAKASYAMGLADSGAAILLADTDWKAATPILAKAGIVACGVGVLADMGKDLPLPLFMGSITAAIFVIIAAMVFAKRPA